MPRKPKFENAPGVKIRENRDGTFNASWHARTDLAKLGYKPSYFPLWRGEVPTAEDRLLVTEHAEMFQADMMTWARGSLVEDPKSLYDGTLKGLIFCYTHDQLSPFHKLRYGSRKGYMEFMGRIEKDHGGAKVRGLSGRDMDGWHSTWKADSGVSLAHGQMRMLRTLLAYGATMLDSDDCAILSAKLGKMRFEMAPARTSFLTADMVIAIRKLAHDKGLHSLALAQAFQFEAMLRQRDVIGEWVPESEPGPGFAFWRTQKWQRGLLWSEIDGTRVLRHNTSKRNKVIEIDLTLLPMVSEELDRADRKDFGPVIVYESTERPYTAWHYRDLWRELANECGIPKTVRNMDSRAGGATEAIDAGADIEHLRHAMTHSNPQTTARYIRGSGTKTNNVARLRVAHRNKTGTEGT